MFTGQKYHNSGVGVNGYGKNPIAARIYFKILSTQILDTKFSPVKVRALKMHTDYNKYKYKGKRRDAKDVFNRGKDEMK